MSDFKFFILVILIFTFTIFGAKKCIDNEWRECESNGGTYFKGQCV